MDEIKLKGMRFHGRHGCLDFEKEQGQTFVVNLQLALDLRRAGSSDDLQDTVNYAQVFETVRSVVEDERYDLIEAVAERIAARVLAEFSRIAEISVEVEKPKAPIEGAFDCVAVSIRRARD